MDAPLTATHYLGNYVGMTLATSRLTSQGQISVPKEVRQRLGLGPGSTVEWQAEGDTIVVRRVGTHGFADQRALLFPDSPPASHSLAELKDGLEAAVRAKHARR